MREKNSSVIFPNQSRSFDGAKNRVRFWGYDSAIEISFFMETSALQKISPDMPDRDDAEAGILQAFDAARDQIEKVADRLYLRSKKNAYAYTLAAEDF